MQEEEEGMDNLELLRLVVNRLLIYRKNIKDRLIFKCLKNKILMRNNYLIRLLRVFKVR
jgi:hypothetical protein